MYSVWCASLPLFPFLHRTSSLFWSSSAFRRLLSYFGHPVFYSDFSTLLSFSVASYKSFYYSSLVSLLISKSSNRFGVFYWLLLLFSSDLPLFGHVSNALPSSSNTLWFMTRPAIPFAAQMISCLRFRFSRTSNRPAGESSTHVKTAFAAVSKSSFQRQW